jgi:hypothetical protein
MKRSARTTGMSCQPVAGSGLAIDAACPGGIPPKAIKQLTRTERHGYGPYNLFKDFIVFGGCCFADHYRWVFVRTHELIFNESSRAED